MQTRKRIFSVLIVAMLLIGSIPIFVLAQATITSLTPASQTIAPSDETTVTLNVADVSDLYGFQANLQFDPAVIEVVDADEITPGVQVALLDTFLQPQMIMTNIADNVAGTIMCVVPQAAAPVSGTGDLFTIAFRGLATGTSDVSFVDLSLFDMNGTPITTTLLSAQVTVSEPLPTPTPTPEEPTPTPEPTTEPTPEPTLTPEPPPQEIGTLLKGLEIDPFRNLVYVAVQSDDTIAIIDGVTFDLIAKVPAGGSAPNGLALNEDGSKLFVVNSGSDNVTVLDANAGYAVIGTIDVGHLPFGISIGGGIAYVTNFDDKTVTMIDANTMGWLNTVPVGWHPSLPAATDDRAYIPNHSSYTGWRSNDPAAELAYIQRQKANDTGISIVHANGDVETIFQEHIGFFAAAIDEVNGRLYVTKRDGTAEGLYVIDMTDNSLIQFIPMLRPYGVAVSPLLQYVFVVQADMNEVYVLDASQGCRLVYVHNTDPNNGDIPGMHGGQGIDVNGSDLVVTNYAAGTLTTSSQSPPTFFDPPIDAEIIRGWQESGGNHGPLGGPIEPSYSYWYSEQQYERGSMHYRQAPLSGPNQIYVFDNLSSKPSGTDWAGRDSGIWTQYNDMWTPGMPLFPAECPEAWWPYGPSFGFGVTWCDEPEVKDTIGYPIGWEYGSIGGEQRFSNGIVFWNPAADAYYVLRNDDHTWTYYRAHRRYEIEIEPNIVGQISLQGRTDNQGILLTSPSGAHTSTDQQGHFGLHYEGQIELHIHYAGYLDMVATVKAGQNANLNMGEIQMLGGDVNGDNRIDILDISYVGYHFGSADPTGDINQDGTIDVLDLSMIGGNFGRTGPVFWQR